MSAFEKNGKVNEMFGADVTLTDENWEEIYSFVKNGGLFIPETLDRISQMAKDEVTAFIYKRGDYTLSPTLRILNEVIGYFLDNPEESLEPLQSEEKYLEFIEHFDLVTEDKNIEELHSLMMDKLQTYQKAAQ